MGQMRFVTPWRERLLPGAAERAYLSGMDGVPFQSRNYWEGDILVVERAVCESAQLNLVWPVDGYGEVTLCTATLVEQRMPYQLPLELARGTLNRLRNRIYEWETAGIRLPAAFHQAVRQATQHFIDSVTLQATPEQSAMAAGVSLREALPLMDRLAELFARQALQARHRRERRLPTLLGARLPPQSLAPAQRDALRAAFNAACVATDWRVIENREGKPDWSEVERQVAWCRGESLRVCLGPLVQLDPGRIPDWLYLWEGDFAGLHDQVCRYVDQAVQRFQRRVHAWHALSRISGGTALSMNEEQRLRLAVSVLETIRRRDQHTPLLISFDELWSESMADDDSQLSPLHFADALVRADLGIAGLGLELNLGYQDGGLPRDVLDIDNRIDRWSTLGLPLLVMLTTPSQPTPDPQARRQARSRAAATPQGPTPATQSDTARRLVSLLLAKPAVQGLIWNQTSDAVPHEFAHGGLFEADGQPKPVLRTLAELRAEHLI